MKATNEANIELLLHYLEVKSASLNLKAQQIRHVLAKNRFGQLSEQEARMELANLFHDIGSLESEDESIFTHYTRLVAEDLENID